MTGAALGGGDWYKNTISRSAQSIQRNDFTYYRKMKTTAVVGVLTLAALLGLAAAGNADGAKKPPRFVDLTNVIEEYQSKISGHPLFKMLADRSIPARKRMSFTPYWAYFAFGFADVLETWMTIPDPKNELEERINIFVREDTFHYNYFFDDMKVLGYTIERFGSFEGVMRHFWGDESRAIREFVYTWAFWSRRFDDPVVTLATFEVVEAGLKDIFEKTYEEVFLPEGGLDGLRYFGGIHVELERNHTHTGWFKGEEIVSTLEDMEITPLQQEQALVAIDEIFKKYVMLYSMQAFSKNFSHITTKIDIDFFECMHFQQSVKRRQKKAS